MSHILLTFENDTQSDQFIQIMRQITEQLLLDNSCLMTIAATVPGTVLKTDVEFVQRAIDTSTRTIPPHGAKCACQAETNPIRSLFVSGKKMAEGTLPEMRKRFQQEIIQHSGSVQIREMRDGKWCTIMQRPKH